MDGPDPAGAAAPFRSATEQRKAVQAARRRAQAPFRALAAAFAVAGAIGLAVGLAFVLLVGASGDPARAAPPVPALAAAVWSAILAAGVGLGLALWQTRRRLLAPLAVLADEVRLLAEVRSAGGLEPGRHPALHPLPEAIGALAAQLVADRGKVDRAVAESTRRVEEQKLRLEAILRDLSEGVLICTLDHRILLFNQVALSLLRVTGELGLGRSVFNVVTREPIVHTFERLMLRGAPGGTPEATAPLVCATADAQILLQARMSLVTGADREASGYVLTLADATQEIAELGRRDGLIRRATEGLRQPVANLRAAAETLGAYPDMPPDQRRKFDDVVRHESAVLSERIDSLDRDYRALSAGEWPLADIHSMDLFNWVIRRLADAGGPQVTQVGLPLWLRGDSHSLALACETLLRELAAATGLAAFDIEALLGDRQVYVELSWEGAPIAAATLDTWLRAPVPGALGAPTLGDVLSRHGSEIWSRPQRPGRSVLRVPVPAPSRVQFAPPMEPQLPARPEFYDFGLLRQAPADPTATQRPLRAVIYVVFDTETTGLRPSAGDDLISIGAVRVVNGRILTGETFSRLINPGRPIPPDSTRFHGITDAMVADAPPATIVLPQFHAFCAGAVLVAHNAAFDLSFLKNREAECGVRFDHLALDTLLISAFLYREIDDHSLDAITRRLGLDVAGRHSALGDALATAAVLVRLFDLLETRGVATLDALVKASNMMLEIKARQAEF